jgi:ketosteroid isomerase-like protein
MRRGRRAKATVKQLRTMKLFTSLGAGFLALTFVCFAAEPSASVKEAVTKAEENWKAAVLKADKSALEKLVSDDLIYTHSSSKTQTKAEFIQDVTGGATVYKSIDFESGKMREYGSVVVIPHNVTTVTVQTGSSHLYLTEVWAKEEGRWQMVSRQATKLPQT